MFLFDIYVYTDIAKKPPKLPGFRHEKIDLFEKFKELNLEEPEEEEGKKYYELYQDLKKITCLTKDLHFNFQSSLFQGYSAYLPFNFKIKKDENEKKYKIFREKNKHYESFEDIKGKEFIESHLNIPIKKINDIDNDPFDYIQNWSQFSSVKNPHAQFTFTMDIIKDFYLSDFPVYFWNITSNEYEFEDNQILRMNYQTYRPDIINIEFNNYFMNIIKNRKFIFEKPSLGKIKDNFLISKGQKKLLKSEKKLYWDYIIENEIFSSYIKCRVDEKEKVNVFVQNSFIMDYLESIRTILSCARLFYSNNYPIIIIESKNFGGNPFLAKIMIQTFQY